MDFLIEVVHDRETIASALQKIELGDKMGFHFTDKEWSSMQEAVKEVPNNAFLAEKLIDQGIDIVHVMEKFTYPKLLKDNLKKEAPILIYTKGNADLLKKNSIAIVGSRKCSETSLHFTDFIAKKAVDNKKVIVSGFAKGIDKQALDSALNYKGRSIIVLPQGIETYQTKTYYPAIVKGDVLVISIYHPKAPWSVGLAMDRNKIIYALAHEIFAAESGSTGGTWEGVINGIKRGRKVFVRKAAPIENNANNLLISKGAIPVDDYGKVVQAENSLLFEFNEAPDTYSINQTPVQTNDGIAEIVIKELINRLGKGITIQEIIDLLKPDSISTTHLNKLLSNHKSLIKTKKGRINVYHLKKNLPDQTSMF